MNRLKFFMENLRYYRALLSCIGMHKTYDDDRWPTYQWILGHRGARSLAPENTISSFRLAMSHGADGVEFDVVPSRDGIPMVIHDDTLERTTNGFGFVWHHESDVLVNLDATKIMSGYVKEGIPTLEAALTALPDGALVNIELKNRGHLSYEQFLESVEPHLFRHKNRLRLLISSFDPLMLLPLRKKEMGLLIALLLSKRESVWPHALSLMRKLAPDAIHITPDLNTPLARLLAKMANLRVAIWTINIPEDAQRYFRQGIDGIFTDNVPQMVHALRR